MQGFFTPAQFGGIHNIIVNETKIVKQFDGIGHGPGIGHQIAKQLVAHKHQQWPDALAP